MNSIRIFAETRWRDVDREELFKIFHRYLWFSWHYRRHHCHAYGDDRIGGTQSNRELEHEHYVSFGY